MRIGTAAPSDEELAAVPHHLVGIVDPDAPWSLVGWLTGARGAIAGVHARGRLSLLVGGTGQYVWSLLEGWDVPAVPADSARRARLEALAATEGYEALHAHLAAVDPASAARIDARNIRRVVRALEIVEVTGAPVPPLQPRDPGFDWHIVGLHWSREEIHRRADARVAAMYAAGLVEETRALVARYGREFEALRSIGYREALSVLDGETTEEHAIERTRIETHRLIRTQAAWFREDDPRIEWIPGDDPAAGVEAVLRADARLGGHG